jgi:hypothetical protein
MPVLSRASPKLLREHRDLRASFLRLVGATAFLIGLRAQSTCNDASRGKRERGSHGGHGATEDF